MTGKLGGAYFEALDLVKNSLAQCEQAQRTSAMTASTPIEVL